MYPDTPSMTAPDTPDPQSTEIALTRRDWDRPWKGAFMQAYALTANIASSARAAGMSRGWVHEVMKSDPLFREAMAEAREVAVDMLEALARKRATQDRRVVVTRTRTLRDASGRVLEEETVEETKVTEGSSDSLVLALLRSQRPEVYGVHAEMRMVGHDGGAVRVEVTRSPSDERVRELLVLAGELGMGDEVVEGEAVEVDEYGDVA